MLTVLVIVSVLVNVGVAVTEVVGDTDAPMVADAVIEIVDEGDGQSTDAAVTASGQDKQADTSVWPVSG